MELSYLDRIKGLRRCLCPVSLLLSPPNILQTSNKYNLRKLRKKKRGDGKILFFCEGGSESKQTFHGCLAEQRKETRAAPRADVQGKSVEPCSAGWLCLL